MVRPTVFISYKRGHEPTAKAVEDAEQLLARLELDSLRDTQLEPGEIWSNELYGWLMQCSAAIAFIGEEAAKSEWCRREWWFLRERQRSTGLPVIPISVDGTRDSAGILDHIQGVKFAGKIDEAAFENLKGLQDLRPSPESYLEAHHAWLRWRFQGAKMWDREPFSLKDIYVETECGKLQWGQINDDASPRDPFVDTEANGGRHNLVDTVMELIRDKSFREPIVIQGPPGCGKSSFTQRIANELLDNGLKPVHVRFRDFRLAQFQRAEELIEDALRIGPVDEEPPRPKDPILDDDLLNRTAKIGDATSSEIVFILDGWDEVSLSGNTSYQAQLVTWLPRIRQYASERPGSPVRLILTGRPSAEVKDSGILTQGTPVLTIRNLRPDALRGFAGAISSLLEKPQMSGADHWTVDLDRLAPVFDSYQKWFEYHNPYDTATDSMDVMGSPLLAFLALRTLADWPGDAADLVKEPTLLYKVLIDTTVEHAGQGTDQNLQQTVRQSGGRLRFLLHRVASIISILGHESVSFTELDLRLGDDPEFTRFYKNGTLPGAVDQETRLTALLGLIVSFFFKGGNTNLGCEFLHKSFREYLFAEAILTVLKEESDGQTRHLRAPQIKYWQDFEEGSPQHKASRRLAALLAPQWLTGQVRTHLFWLIEREVEEDRERWIWIRDLILDVYIWWAEGVHLRPQPAGNHGSTSWSPSLAEDMLKNALPFDGTAAVEPPRSAALDAHLGEALMQITARIHAMLRDMPAAEEDDDSLRNKYRHKTESLAFAPGGGGYYRTICARINAAGWRPDGVFAAGADLRNISLHGESAELESFGYADLRGADLRNAEMTGANLYAADLRGADLSSAELLSADLRTAKLDGADLSYTELYEADLSGASLRKAKMSRVDLNRADLEGARLVRADMEAADLTEARLRGANLEGAILRQAILKRANLLDADLREAVLVQAEFLRANLTHARFMGADLTEADLSVTTCSQIRLNGSRLHSAKFSAAKGLQQHEINGATGNAQTKLPDDLSHPAHWSEEES